MALSPQKKPKYAPEQRQKKKGLIIVHTGDGKGKTTAALGTAFRAAGCGLKVSVIQFIKANGSTVNSSPPESSKTRLKFFRWEKVLLGTRKTGSAILR